MFPFNLLSDPWNPHKALQEMTMMPFIQFLAPLIGGLGSALGAGAAGLGGALGSLGGAAGGLLSKLPLLGKGGLGLGKMLTNVTGAQGLGGLLGGPKGIGGLLGQLGSKATALGGPVDPNSILSRAGHGIGGAIGDIGGQVGKGAEAIGGAPQKMLDAFTPNPADAATRPFVDPTRPTLGPNPQWDQNGDGAPDWGGVNNPQAPAAPAGGGMGKAAEVAAPLLMSLYGQNQAAQQQALAQQQANANAIMNSPSQFS